MDHQDNNIDPQTPENSLTQESTIYHYSTDLSNLSLLQQLYHHPPIFQEKKTLLKKTKSPKF